MHHESCYCFCYSWLINYNKRVIKKSIIIITGTTYGHDKFLDSIFFEKITKK